MIGISYHMIIVPYKPNFHYLAHVKYKSTLFNNGVFAYPFGLQQLQGLPMIEGTSILVKYG